jgi:hypothetical protein
MVELEHLKAALESVEHWRQVALNNQAHTRALIAASILSGILANPNVIKGCYYLGDDGLTRRAVKFADDLIQELNQPNQ